MSFIEEKFQMYSNIFWNEELQKINDSQKLDFYEETS